MSETMKDYEAEINASFRKIDAGDIVTGTVIAVTEEEVTVDLRYYAPGIIRAADYSDDPDCILKEAVQVGDTIEATVMRTDDGEGNILLSKKEANNVLAWDVLKGYLEDESVHTVRVKGIVPSGVVAYLEGIRGFIPASQLSLDYVEDCNPFLGKDLDVRVITVDRDKEKLVLSAPVWVPEPVWVRSPCRDWSIPVRKISTRAEQASRRMSRFCSWSKR